LDQAGVALIFIGCASVEQTREFLDRLELPFPGELYIDLARKSHKAFGLFRGIYQSLIPPIIDGVQKYGWKGVIEGARLGWETAHLAGDSWQQGGTFLLGPGKACHFAHREAHPGDWADMNFVLGKFIQKEGEDNEIAVDYKKAISTYLDVRETNRAKAGKNSNAKVMTFTAIILIALIALLISYFLA